MCLYMQGNTLHTCRNTCICISFVNQAFDPCLFVQKTATIKIKKKRNKINGDGLVYELHLYSTQSAIKDLY